jgi:hypothetical protein
VKPTPSGGSANSILPSKTQELKTKKNLPLLTLSKKEQFFYN